MKVYILYETIHEIIDENRYVNRDETIDQTRHKIIGETRNEAIDESINDRLDYRHDYSF